MELEKNEFKSWYFPYSKIAIAFEKCFNFGPSRKKNDFIYFIENKIIENRKKWDLILRQKMNEIKEFGVIIYFGWFPVETFHWQKKKTTKINKILSNLITFGINW